MSIPATKPAIQTINFVGSLPSPPQVPIPSGKDAGQWSAYQAQINTWWTGVQTLLDRNWREIELRMANLVNKIASQASVNPCDPLSKELALIQEEFTLIQEEVASIIAGSKNTPIPQDQQLLSAIKNDPRWINRWDIPLSDLGIPKTDIHLGNRKIVSSGAILPSDSGSTLVTKDYVNGVTLPPVPKVYSFAPSQTWTKVHGLGFRPIVKLISGLGTELDGVVKYPNLNTVIAEFGAPLAGLMQLYPPSL